MGSPDTEERRSPDEGPQHEVRFAQPFALGRYPVTSDEYDHFCLETRRERLPDQGWRRGRRPAINVSWEDAQAYCTWLSQQTEQGYRLPTEAEWEYACRAGTTTPFWTGATISTDQANYNGQYTYGPSREGGARRQRTVVDAFPANPWGLYDMHGNVFEWCEDSYNDTYEKAAKHGTAWTDPGISWRVLRGGAWISPPWDLRSASRDGNGPDVRGVTIGFRVARTLSRGDSP
jgi:formylglycine-generating enzyme required for sulfatase activity